MSKLPKLVEPSSVPLSPREEAAARLTGRGGLGAADAEWVVDLFFAPGVLPPDAETREYVIGRFANELHDHERDLARALLLHIFDHDRIDMGGVQVNGEPWTMTQEARALCFKTLRDRGLPVQQSIIGIWALLRSPAQLVRELRSFGLFDHVAALDLEELSAHADEPGFTATIPNTESRFSRPSSLNCWLRDWGADALIGLPEVLAAKTNDDEAARLARGIANLMSGHLCRDCRMHPESFERLPTQYHSSCRAIFDDLDRRMLRSASPSLVLRRTWSRWGLMAFAPHPTSMPEAIRQRLLAAAAEELGRLRSLMRHAEDEGAAAEFQSLYEPRVVAENTLFRFGSLWQGLKPLLLLLRAITVPAVGADLRSWNELGLPSPPVPWNEIVERFAGSLHGFGGAEQLGDRELADLRASFAEYCLERLKSRSAKKQGSSETDAVEASGPLEDDPIWRRAYIRALRELRVSPRGRGHRVLHQCMNNDPDPEIRECARIAYGELRHSPTLGDGMSPRAVVLAAHWWLRQAHRQSLGADVEPRGAQRTHDKETHRAKEIERAQLAP